VSQFGGGEKQLSGQFAMRKSQAPKTIFGFRRLHRAQKMCATFCGVFSA
jgi:hypothetical protein